MSQQLEPVIKWSGSTRAIASALSKLFGTAGQFYDPFVGGGALLPYRTTRTAIVGDIIPELIGLWQLIQGDPELVSAGYARRWQRLQKEGHKAFYAIRDSFNAKRDPLDLLFLTRTCVNGLIRFNSDREFNNSLHHTRPGIAPERLRRITLLWNQIVRGIAFRTADYRETLESVKRGDLIFLDPPYACNRGRYRREAFDVDAFFGELDRLNRIGARWILTFDGQAGNRVYEGGVPQGLYRQRLAVSTGNSPFTRLMGTALDAVTESVYLNFNPPGEALGQFNQLRGYPSSFRDGENMNQYAFLAGDELHS
jgi:DNA adenine methylase